MAINAERGPKSEDLEPRYSEHHAGSTSDPSRIFDWKLVLWLRDRFEHRGIEYGMFLKYREEWATVDLLEGLPSHGDVFTSEAHRIALAASYAAYRDGVE